MTRRAAASNRNQYIIVRTVRWLALAAGLAGAALAQNPPARVSEAALMRHIAVLADDAMEGRKPGTPGGVKAANYIAAEMQAAGLRPGAADGGWFQPVGLVERRPGHARTRWRVKRRAIAVTPDEILLLGREPGQRLAAAPLVFGGYGLKENLAGVDLSGAVVLLFAGKPAGAPDAPSFDVRRDAIAEAGAAAVVTLMPASTSWKTVREQYAAGRNWLVSDGGAAIWGAMAYPAWTRLLAAAGSDPAKVHVDAGERGFHAFPLQGKADLSVSTAVRRYQSVNVVGRIEGAGKRDEALLYTSHWDHLGICRPPSSPDRICNGAIDNASGVAVMIEAARGLANGPKPERSILFVATTAEEMGLLGARAFVRDPPVPLKSIVAALNLDTIAIAPRGMAVGIIGRGMTRLDALIDDTARAMGRKVDPGSEANSYVMRQDGWALMSAGIPAVMVGGGFSDRAALARYFARRYHGPSDDLSQGIELGGAAEDADLHVALGRVLADPSRFPSSAR